MKIKKLIFITSSGEETIPSPSEVQEFFDIINCGGISSSMKKIPKRFSKFVKYKFLLTACLRKLFRMKFNVSKNMRLSLLNRLFSKISYEDVIRLGVSIKNKTIYFKADKSQLWELIFLIEQIVQNNQYNINKTNVNNKTIIDAGANTGVFSILTILMGAEKVYAFEPVSNTVDLLLGNVKLNNMQNKVIVFNKAVGDRNYVSKVCFNDHGDKGAKLIDAKREGLSEFKSYEEVEIIKLDSFVLDNKINKIDFIKMDVEGFEKKTILGAKKIISKFKPILSLSAYHQSTDKETLPKTIKSIRKDYKIKLNSFDEEVFYCY